MDIFIYSINNLIYITNVQNQTRFDSTGFFKTNYGSKSGRDVKVTVAVPLNANPPPQESDITWYGPTGQLTTSLTVSQQSTIYNHLVTSSIPVQDPNSFGNYTMMFNGESIVTVIISAEGIISKCSYCVN